MATAIRHLTTRGIVLVIDDFHYLQDETRLEFLRNIKGAVFNGLKVLLLSVTHRAFDAIKTETELTGRFTAITVPEWSMADLKKIPAEGFRALSVACGESIVTDLADEAQESPFLIYKFCWQICYDLAIMNLPDTIIRVPEDYPLIKLYTRIAKDSGVADLSKTGCRSTSEEERLRRPLANWIRGRCMRPLYWLSQKLAQNRF